MVIALVLVNIVSSWAINGRSETCVPLIFQHAAISTNTDNPLYTDTRYNDKIQFDCHETFAQEVTVDEKLCKNITLKLLATYDLVICELAQRPNLISFQAGRRLA